MCVHHAQMRLTHQLLNNGVHIGQHMRVTSEDILLNSPPFFHCFGLVLGNLAFWTHGACVVVAKCAVAR